MPLARSIFPYRCAVCSVLLAGVLTGCGDKKPPPKPVEKYATLPPKQVPAFLRDTIYQRTDLVDTEPLAVSGFGIVTRLQGTGDNTLLPTSVRSFIINQMVKNGFGSKLQVPPFSEMKPEDMLRDPSVAVVRVDAFIPPGARQFDHFDVQVSALKESATSSLAHGLLYRADLKRNGANNIDPGYEVNIPAVAEGYVFVNPVYAANSQKVSDTAAKDSLRYGVILDGGVCLEYRPLMLRLRAPQRSMSRAIEALIEQRFASLKAYKEDKLAAAKDEAVVLVQLPESYHGDWQHFAGVMTHLYLDTRPDVLAVRAQKLAEEAVKPDAPLEDISYCWEGLDRAALPTLAKLMGHEKPEVAYAAARAAAYIGDPAALTALAGMASRAGHPFQIAAVRILGDVPMSPQVCAILRDLLNSDQSLVRIEAYRVLARAEDPSIYSKVINGKFRLDIVPSSGPPLIYASRRGQPRIAVIGNKPSMSMPAMFRTLDDQLTISSNGQQKTVTIFYRGPQVTHPTAIASNPDVAEIVARLGGEGPDGTAGLNFSYGDVVAIVQAMADARQLSARSIDGRRQEVAFVLQQAPRVESKISGAPAIPDQRPQGTGSSDPRERKPAKPAAASDRVDVTPDLAHDARPQ
jgi:hypothetical protein